MEEETGFRRSPTPPDTMEDYRSAVADSTSSGNARNEPIPLSYRQVEVPNNDASRPTATGYVNGGLSINNRPRLPEPVERGEGPVSLEVDFDSKMTDAYEKLNDARHGYHVARSASYQYSPERVQNEMNPMYKGVHNNSKKEKRQACRTCFLHSCLAVLILTNVLGILLGGFNLANTFNIGTITSGTQSGSTVDPSLQNMIQQLRTNLSELHRDFGLFNDAHSVNYSNVKDRLLQLQVMIDSLTMTTPSSSNEVTTPPASTNAPTPVVDNTLSIPLYENCTIRMVTSCSTTSFGNRGSQMFQFCATSATSISHDDDDYITEVFCSIDSEQIKPVTSSLRYDNGEWSCVCQGLEVPHLVELELESFDCELYVRECPSAISIPRN